MKLAPAFAALFALALAGCGFHPLYAVPDRGNGEMQTQLKSIYVAPVADTVGYELRNRVIDLIDGPGRPQGAAYRLEMTLVTKNDAIGVQSQKVGSLKETMITRYNDTLTVEYRLIDAKNGAILTKGVETGLSAYNVLSSPYATLAAQRDADRHAAEDIADRIRIALAAYFAQVK